MLQINHISKLWHKGTADQRPALVDLSLHLNKGDFLTVVGSNGSGKSTLLSLIAGVYAPDKGSISLAGIELTGMPEYRRARYVGRVFQDPLVGSAAGMTIEENLALAMRRGRRRTLRWGVAPKEVQQFRDMLAQLNLGLENRLSSKVGLLSGGQRQALTLLMAVAAKPRLLLLDEHTAALDPKTAHKVMALSHTMIKDQSLTAIMVTHSMKDALTYGNRLVMLQEGEVIFSAEGKEKEKLDVMDLLGKFYKAAEEIPLQANIDRHKKTG